MTADIATTLAMLQYGDSFFPSGSVSFSWGLEGLADSGVIQSAEAAHVFVIGQLRGRWANFDRPALVAAHRAGDSVEEVAVIDELVEIQTASAELRSGSRRMGEALLSVFVRLGIRDAAAYRDVIRSGGAFGHLPVMQGFLWSRVGLSNSQAVALSAHTFCTGLLGAGIRLGCLTHIDAQRTLTEAGAVAARLADRPVAAIDELSSYGVEAEIAVMRHVSNHLRVFAN